MYSFKILQNCSRDLFHSSVLLFDQKTYLFNCSDGTQRNAIEQSIKFHKISNIFYNSAHIDAYLGSYGMLMSRNEQVTGQLLAHMQSSGSAENFDRGITLWGPPLFNRNFMNCKRFFTDKVHDYIHDFSTEFNSFVSSKGIKQEHFEDENVKIYPFCTSTLEHKMDIDSDGDELKNLSTKKNDYAMSYLCVPQLKPKPFLPAKAKALGLKPGPAYGLLQKGQTVTHEGKEIKPEDVLGDQSPASCVAILYSPTLEHALNLTQHKHLLSQLNDKNDRTLTLIVHILGDSNILKSNFYQEFINSIDSKTVHIFDCKETNIKFMLNEGKHKMKYILNKADGDFFNNDMFKIEDTFPKFNLYDLIKQSNNLVASFPGFEYCLYPIEKRKVLQEKIYEPFIYKNEFFQKFVNKIDSIVNTLDLKETIKKTENLYKNEPRVTFLGTVSMKPGIYRNVSSIMLSLANNSNILLDCGEGTFQQIYDHFGDNNCTNIIENIRIIFITHKHGDHMLGTLKVLSEIDKIKKQKGVNPKSLSESEIIFLVAPKTILKWLRNSIHDLEYHSQIILLDCNEVNPHMEKVYANYVTKSNPYNNFKDVDLVKDILKIDERIKDYKNQITNGNVKFYFQYLNNYLGINLYTIEVFHCDESFGCFVEEVNRAWKISYSGDTRPCNNFWNYTMYSTLFIHESTFDDELQSHAVEKMHTTFSEAINIGEANESWRIALTHFSPRYIKVTPWKEIFEEKKILLSHDFLSLKLSNFEFGYLYSKRLAEIIDVVEKNSLLKADEE
jgi:ribonuclease Z